MEHIFHASYKILLHKGKRYINALLTWINMLQAICDHVRILQSQIKVIGHKQRYGYSGDRMIRVTSGYCNMQMGTIGGELDSLRLSHHTELVTQHFQLPWWLQDKVQDCGSEGPGFQPSD